MRTAFFQALMAAAEADPRVWLVVGDLGFGVVEPFAAKYPKRFLNVGVAEQNMTGVAAGLALSGKVVFTYSIGNFPTLRCLEQIRNDVCYHQANVKVVAVGGGFAYGALGATHHAVEDIAIMRSLSGMQVVAPGDPIEAGAATRAIAEAAGPWYLRLGRSGEANVHTSAIDFELGKSVRVRDGEDITLVSTGSMLRTAMQAAESLAGRGIQARVLSMHTVKPLDRTALEAAAGETGAILTLEDHVRSGGLGGAVAEVLLEGGWGIRFRQLGLPVKLESITGSQEYLLVHYGLSAANVAQAAEELLTRGRGSPGLALKAKTRK